MTICKNCGVDIGNKLRHFCKLCETCGQLLDIDEAQAGDAVCRSCICNWEKESGICNDEDYN